MADPLSTLALATGGAFLGKFVGPAAEALGKAAWERAQQAGARATAMLSAVGREPQPVEPKLLVPVAQGAGLETDPAMAELWAALLANAADPAQRVAIHPSYPEILRQLSPEDASMLDFIANYHQPQGDKPGLPCPPTHAEAIRRFDWQAAARPEVNIANLLRLGLCRSGEFDCFLGNSSVYTVEEALTIPIYGHLFLQAVTPPTP